METSNKEVTELTELWMRCTGTAPPLEYVGRFAASLRRTADKKKAPPVSASSASASHAPTLSPEIKEKEAKAKAPIRFDLDEDSLKELAENVWDSGLIESRSRLLVEIFQPMVIEFIDAALHAHAPALLAKAQELVAAVGRLADQSTADKDASPSASPRP